MAAIVGAVQMDPEDAPKGVSWPTKCRSCGYEDDGNRIQLSPKHVPYPLPVPTQKEPSHEHTTNE